MAKRPVYFMIAGIVAGTQTPRNCSVLLLRCSLHGNTLSQAVDARQLLHVIQKNNYYIKKGEPPFEGDPPFLWCIVFVYN